MRGYVIVGIILILVGVAALVYGGVTYTTREDVLKVGPIDVTAKTKKTVPLSPVLGGAAIVGGVVLVMLGTRKG